MRRYPFSLFNETTKISIGLQGLNIFESISIHDCGFHALNEISAIKLHAPCEAFCGKIVQILYRLHFTFAILMNAFIFPGQGSQFSGMGKKIAEQFPASKAIFSQADSILGFPISSIMFEGSEEELRQTKVTQPAVFIHSMATIASLENFKPEMTAGHSLGEFSALVAAGCLHLEDALKLVYARALAMQEACDAIPGTMAAVLGLEDEKVEEVCRNVHGVVVAANYNCPGQLVISGSKEAIIEACEAMKAAGAKRALPLPVGGAFHSPLMEPAREKLATAIKETKFMVPLCPIYQNVSAKGELNPVEIQNNLMAQLTAPVKWTQSVRQMWQDGAKSFTECGPGAVLQGLVRKICPESQVLGMGN